MEKKRLRRSESYIGIHFDFHARADDKNIGKNTTKEMIEQIIKETAVDYIQCDCKGHPGYSSYPTRVGNAAPGIIKDALKIWRSVTKKHGVALYMHYSGVWDTAAIAQRSDWGRIDENGNPDKNNTSVFGPYVDDLLIPQLIELANKYCVDGVWVDGECWATAQDYCEKAIRAFKKEKGITEIPRAISEKYFYEYTQFCREAFKKYLRHYVDKVHFACKGFQICSNWAFSSFMPEKVSADVDFLSGDISLNNSVNEARLEARCLMHQGLPWDLMSWGFGGKFGDEVYSTKTAVQLMQEAAVIISLGGGYQTYFSQNRDGSVSLYQMSVVQEVVKFCRKRQRFCHKAKSVPQIGLILSSYAFYKANPRLFGSWREGVLDPLKGILQCLIDGSKCVDVVMEHNLGNDINRFPMLILPEWNCLEEGFRIQLIDYVRNGGKLLIIGNKASKMFLDELGTEAKLNENETTKLWVSSGNLLSGVVSHIDKLSAKDKTKVIARAYYNNDFNSESTVVATMRKVGAGTIGAVYIDIGKKYLKGATSDIRDFISDIVDQKLPVQKVTIDSA